MLAIKNNIKYWMIAIKNNTEKYKFKNPSAEFRLDKKTTTPQKTHSVLLSAHTVLGPNTQQEITNTVQQHVYLCILWHTQYSNSISYFNPLRAKHKQFSLKTQFVPHSEHFPPRL